MIATPALAQQNKILADNIETLQVVAGDNWLTMPVIELNGSEVVNISFDDLTHEYHRYAYRIEHCEANWTTSEDIFRSDYCAGFTEDITIEDVEESYNTNILYTHYAFQIPNERCRLKLSGNYRVTIYDENEGRDVAEACFMVVDQQMTVGMRATTNTDIDVNKKHQQVAVQLDYGNINITNPQLEITMLVMQNGRWETAVVNPTVQYTMRNGMKWEHNRQLIFLGGNECRKFETLDVSHTTMGLESVDWDGNDYHAYVWTDEPRPNYLYDEDANGHFYIRNSDNVDNDTSTEYLYVHFALKTDMPNGDIYLAGVWTNGELTDKYKMKYNPSSQCFENSVLLKQGYYSYYYVLKQPDGTIITLPSEGNFSETENRYQCLVYYRGTGQRTDQLLGFGQVELN